MQLASTVHCELRHDSFPVSRVGDDGLRALEAWCDVLVFQGHVMHDFPWLRDSKKVLLVDIYDPIHLEVLEQSREQTDWDRRNLSRITVEVLNDQLAGRPLPLPRARSSATSGSASWPPSVASTPPPTTTARTSSG